MSEVRTEAIILRRTDYGEADRILLLLTPEGKRSAIARGVRREKSKLAGGIELFGVSDVVLRKGKGELGIVSSARLTRFYRHILEEYDRLQCAYDIMKHITRASEETDEPDWFDCLVEVFAGLDGGTDVSLVRTWFYLRYSVLMGHALSFTYDTTGERLDPERRYHYDEMERGLRLAENGDITANHIKFLRLVAVKPLKSVAQIGGVDEILPGCLFVARMHAAIE